eukprot:TRINITY_DN8383_c0_g1_i1.p1 TRINITY_DN8383_c0_g1~~TRINITY_DN8383_c0_g1_i1.p1  ORF type:complete len:529 (-),score=96.82 TRINITY_DN8383_c0_g1_i1:3-1589(-)
MGNSSSTSQDENILYEEFALLRNKKRDPESFKRLLRPFLSDLSSYKYRKWSELPDLIRKLNTLAEEVHRREGISIATLNMDIFEARDLFKCLSSFDDADLLKVQSCQLLHRLVLEDPDCLSEVLHGFIISSMAADYQQERQLTYRMLKVISLPSAEDIRAGILGDKYSLQGTMKLFTTLVKTRSNFRRPIVGVLNSMIEENGQIVEATIESGLFRLLLETYGLVRYNFEERSFDGPYFSTLPPGGLFHQQIFSWLDSGADLARCHVVCKKWRALARKTLLEERRDLYSEYDYQAIIDILCSVASRPEGAFEVLEQTDFVSIVKFLKQHEQIPSEIIRSIINLISRVSRNAASGAEIISKETDALVDRRNMGSLPRLMSLGRNFNVRQEAFLAVVNVVSLLVDPQQFDVLQKAGIFNAVVEYVKRDASVVKNLQSCVTRSVMLQDRIVQAQIIPGLIPFLQANDNDVHKEVLGLLAILSRRSATIPIMRKDKELAAAILDLQKRSIWEPVRFYTSQLTRSLGLSAVKLI